MLKWIVTVKRRPGVEREALFEHWQHKHAPNVVSLFQPEKYCITFFDPDDDGGIAMDGMAEIWFRDRAHFERSIGPDIPLARETDGFGEYSNYEDGFGLLTSEHIRVDGAVGPDDTKLNFFVKRREGVTQAALFEYWTTIHMPTVSRAVEQSPDALRYTVALADQGRDGLYDGMASIWFRNADAQLADLRRQPDGFRDLQSFMTVRGREIAVVG